MCPVTLAAGLGLSTAAAGATAGAAASTFSFGSILSTLGTAASLVSGVGGAIASRNEAKAASAAAAFNAGERDKAAVDALERGKTETQKQQQAARALAGRQRATQAANGVLMSGSAQRLTEDDYQLGVEDALQTKANARREADGHSSNAAIIRAEGAAASPSLALGTSLAGTASRVSSRWDWMRDAPVASADAGAGKYNTKVGAGGYGDDDLLGIF